MGATFRSVGVEVVVPATSANLGPGFDCLGLALGIHDHLAAMVTEDPGVLVHVEGEGAEYLPRDERHLVARAMARAWDAMGIEAPGVIVKCDNTIPQSRGLGSSAAAIVGGILLARGLVTDGAQRLPDEAVLDLAASMEGHPDNVAATLLGGFTTAWVATPGADDMHAGAVRRDVHESVVPVVLVAPSGMSTASARRMLVDQVSRDDAVFNLGRVALLIHALTAEPAHLMAATEDRLHQDARSGAYAQSHALVVELRGEGVPAVISGAGPSVLAFADEGTVALVTERAPQGWTALVVDADPAGARIHIRGA
ncbi:MAG: homoserine kinase [Actinobacteria bacterium]|nr:homoserine kinase [Actinomycetota bacterium]